MANIRLKPTVPAAVPPITEGTVFYPPVAEDVSSSPLQQLDAAGLGEIGAASDSETMAQPAPVVATAVPVAAAPATPALQPTVANDPRVDALLQRISGVAEAAKTEIEFLRAEVARNMHDNVHPRIEFVEAQLKRVIETAGKSDGAAAALKRLDTLDAMLSQSGLQTSETAALPQLHLRRYPATRHIIRKPEVAADGNSVTLFYNPKPAGPGENGEMVELNITTAGRRIATGYTVDVPDGYVCDVVVGTDVVASVQGRGEAELSVLLTSRGPARHVGAGYEIAKLTLRRMERLTAKVD